MLHVWRVKMSHSPTRSEHRALAGLGLPPRRRTGSTRPCASETRAMISNSAPRAERLTRSGVTSRVVGGGRWLPAPGGSGSPGRDRRLIRKGVLPPRVGVASGASGSCLGRLDGCPVTPSGSPWIEGHMAWAAPRGRGLAPPQSPDAPIANAAFGSHAAALVDEDEVGTGRRLVPASKVSHPAIPASPGDMHRQDAPP